MSADDVWVTFDGFSPDRTVYVRANAVSAVTQQRPLGDLERPWAIVVVDGCRVDVCERAGVVVAMLQKAMNP